MGSSNKVLNYILILRKILNEFVAADVVLPQSTMFKVLSRYGTKVLAYDLYIAKFNEYRCSKNVPNSSVAPAYVL